MNSRHPGEYLIRSLLSSPVSFCARGEENSLLKEYFRGLPLETLRPLLSHSDRVVRRAAVWIGSELGKEAACLIQSAIPLLSDPEPYVRFYALEIVAVCSVAGDSDKYVHVIRLLADDDQLVRVEAMFLISNADASQLEAALRSLQANWPNQEVHKVGLSQLLADDPTTPKLVLSMISSADALLRKYGAIAGWRLLHKFPGLEQQIVFSNDSDVRKFWKQRERH